MSKESDGRESERNDGGGGESGKTGLGVQSGLPEGGFQSKRWGNENENGSSSKGNRFSYKEKLLGLGESGFLESMDLDADAMKGWRQYFAKMSQASEENED